MTLADTPTTWENPPPMSMLHALLLFGGIPLLIVAVITLLVMAPSLAKGPRYRLGQEWDAKPEWFGAVPQGGDVPAGRQIGAAAAAPGEPALDTPDTHRGVDDDETGGASVGW